MTVLRILIAVLVLGSGVASASTTTYGSKALLESGNLDLTFTNIPFDGYVGTYNTAAGLIEAVTNTTFVGVSNSAFDLQVVNALGTWASAPALRTLNNNGTITVTLPANTFAFGADLLIASGNAFLGFDVVFNNGSTQSFTTSTAVATPGSLYVGVRSSTPITMVSFTNELSSAAMGLD